MKRSYDFYDLQNQFITRLVYFGTYRGTEEYLQKKFETVIKYLRSEYSDSPVTGLLLVYPFYFVHVIEASEEMIYRHLQAIFNEEGMKINLGRVLPLPPYHHVHKLGSVDEVLKSLGDENDQRYLPESTLIEFLLKSKSSILRDIREYVELARIVPHIKLYNGNGSISTKIKKRRLKTIIYLRICTISKKRFLYVVLGLHIKFD
ncbi:uncharacterized protein [Venturia canescens]|uniref:uncharacterized protein n=1 Tax=Venturia canescens TaxID=32260 RepID=UPI001C9CBA0E|nr:uncharacterized protein LOC122412120 [Venturia canescens]